MTHRRIFGLLFKVFSPSLYELVATDDGSPIAIVTIAFTGEWNISVLMKRGHTIYRGPFRYRDEAMLLIANRRAA
jgi:hypothetical protein